MPLSLRAAKPCSLFSPTVPEIFTYSSNIGTARMALQMGVEHHKWFLKKMGQLDRLRTDRQFR